jgi:hypothetical protein
MSSIAKSMRTFQHDYIGWVPGSAGSGTNDMLKILVQEDLGNTDAHGPLFGRVGIGMFPSTVKHYGGYIGGEAKDDGVAEKVPGVCHRCGRGLTRQEMLGSDDALLCLRKGRRTSLGECPDTVSSSHVLILVAMLATSL